MSVVTYLFAGAGLFFLSIFVGIGGYQAKQRSRVRERWRKARGKVLEFGLTANCPEVIYEYTVDGEAYRGYRMMINHPNEAGAHHMPVKAPLYQDRYGRLRYTPGQTIEVLYDPDAPEQSVLTNDSPGNLVIPIGILLLFFGGVIAAILHQNELITIGKTHKALLGGGAFTFVGVICLLIFLRLLLKHLRSRDFSSVEGRVLEAAPKLMPSKKGRSYTLDLKYEYEVQGVRYFSRQIYALGIAVGQSSLKAVEKQAAELLAEPRVRIWYDPRAPWRCYLRQGPLWVTFFLLIFVILFGGLGLMILLERL